MNANALARHYDRLTPQERFALIFAAGGRGDEAEQGRLVNAGGRVSLSMSDHMPYAHAFDELATLTFIELLDAAATYQQANEQADDALDLFGGEGGADEGDADGEATASEGTAGSGGGGSPAWTRHLGIAYAAGYVLRTKAEGWELFCGRLHVQPFLLWRSYPGLERLQRALALAKEAAFDRDGMLRWMNKIRPAGEPEFTEVRLTAQRVADANEEAFRYWVKRWGG